MAAALPNHFINCFLVLGLAGSYKEWRQSSRGLARHSGLREVEGEGKGHKGDEGPV